MHAVCIMILVIQKIQMNDSNRFIRNKRPNFYRNNEPFVLYKSYNTTVKKLVFNGYQKHRDVLSQLSNNELKSSELADQSNIFRPAFQVDRNESKGSSSIKSYYKSRSSEKNLLYSKQRSKRVLHGVGQIKSVYKSLKNGKFIYNHESINTVRYIPSTKVNSNNKLYFLFNLSLLTNTEKLMKSDLFINRKYVRQRLAFDLHYLLYSTLSKSGFNKTESVPRKSQNGPSMTIDLRNAHMNRFSRENQWQSFDIVRSIQSYLNVRNSQQTARNISDSVYYTVDNDKPNMTGDELMLMMEADVLQRVRRGNRRRRNLPEFFNPYIMVYSNENDEKMRNFFENKVSKQIHSKSSDVKSTTTNAVKPIENVLKYASKEEMKNLKKFEEQVDQLNKLDHDGEDLDIDTVKVPAISVDKSSINKSNVLADYLIKKSSSHESSLNHYDEYLAQTDKIIYGNHRNKYHKRSINDRENGLFVDSKFNQTLLELFKKQKSEDVGCSKKSLLIDFMDLSFSDWIIQPMRFRSNYCSGGCKFPSNKKITNSNYATLQSIMNSLNFLNTRNSIPELCCTPSKTQSLPILYIDKNSIDHVVKLLPDMIVNECSCH